MRPKIKKTFVAVAVVMVAILLGGCAASRSQANAGGSSNPLVGVWRNVTPGHPGEMIKFMTESHFAWTWTFDGITMTSATGETYVFNNAIMNAAGGTYTFDGTTHIETIRYTTPNMANMIGQQATVTIRFEGNNRFYTSGAFAGNVLNEVWERME